MQIYIFFKKVSEWMHSVHSPKIQGEARHFSKTEKLPFFMGVSKDDAQYVKPSLGRG